MKPGSEIWIVEAHRTGFVHTSFNAGLIESVAAAFPDRPIVFASESDHGEQVRTLLPAQVRSRMDVRWIDTGDLADAWSRHRARAGEPEYSIRKAWAARSVLAGVLKSASGVGAVVFTSADAPILTALWSLRRFGPLAGLPCQVILHGELADVSGWRARRPITRFLQLRSAISRWLTGGGRLTVLESHIPDTLRTALTELNGSASGIHVYPHPIPSSARQLESGPLPPSSTPTRIGFLGRVTRGKGIEEFVQLARRFQDRSDVHFEVHGWLPPNAPALDLRGLDVAPSPTPLTYAAYLSALQSLDYVCLPLPGSYYDFAASGTLLDAIAGLTPIIILDTPLARVIFREAGDIGDLCEDAEALARAVEQIADRVDPGRRGRQVECMRMFRDTRHPTRLAGRLASGWLED